MAAASLLTVTGTQVVAQAAAPPDPETGFSSPFSGPESYEYLAPTQATDPSQINQPIGRKRADKIARALGLKKQHTLTGQQFFKFISGGGIGNVPAYSALARRSVQIFTNTRGNPLAYFELDSERDEPAYTVLASYGLFVNRQGLLMSLANDFAPTKKANFLLPPLGYVDTWLVANGAASSWFQLYSSAYLAVAADGFKSQNLPQSVPAQLVTNTKAGESTHVGMSMAPALWLTNFCLVYTLSPDAAAEMPAYWAPIPKPVAKAILDSDYGVVPYSEYAKYFESR